MTLSLVDYELISAYMDGQLSGREKNRLEEKLKTSFEWRMALDELQQTRAVLRKAPMRKVPHSFTLTRSMVQQNAHRSWLPALAAFRFSSALAVLSLVAVFALQLLPSAAPLSTPPMNASATGAETQKSLASPESAAADNPSGSQILNWSPLGRGGGGGDAPVQPGLAAVEAPKGMGGGPEGVTPFNGGTISLPPQAVPSLPPASNPQPANPNDNSAPVENPILGVPAQGEGGQIISDSSYQALSDEFVSQTSSFWNSQRTAQASLLGVFVLASAAALVTWRRFIR